MVYIPHDHAYITGVTSEKRLGEPQNILIDMEEQICKKKKGHIIIL